QVITMIREFQGFGGYFFVFEYLLQPAGFRMWIPVYPIDVVKSKLQTDGFTSQTRQYKKTNVKGFFKGFGACMLRAAPVNAFTFVAYELAMRAIDKL
ncbi:18112_t:CDS:2, partial [Gigaspora margarita]